MDNDPNVPRNVLTFEGVVENGQIRLNVAVRLPEKTKVYVVVPGEAVESTSRVVSPRLVNPEQAVDFQLEVVETRPDAGV